MYFFLLFHPFPFLASALGPNEFGCGILATCGWWTSARARAIDWSAWLIKWSIDWRTEQDFYKKGKTESRTQSVRCVWSPICRFSDGDASQSGQDQGTWMDLISHTENHVLCYYLTVIRTLREDSDFNMGLKYSEWQWGDSGNERLLSFLLLYFSAQIRF